MIALAVGLGVLGIFALRRARRRCYGGGYRAYGWYGPWASADGCGDGDCEEHGEHGEHGYGPPWMRGRHHRHGRRGRWGRRWMMNRALDRIDATPAQERVIVGEIERLQERLRDTRSGLKDARVDLAAALRGPVLDDAALGAVLGRVDGATGEARGAVLEALRNIHAVLDDKQRGLLADMLERRRGGGGGAGGGFRTGPYR
jgi:uncharacterized membrane protein